VVTATDYYPFGMPMPGRNGIAFQSDWVPGRGFVAGSTYPDYLQVASRPYAPSPGLYKAGKEVELLPGFETATATDELLVEIQAGSGVLSNDYPGGQGSNDMYGAYRYGFNGKENDNEVKGAGNQQDYGMRIYDPRLGRFLSVDPITKKYPELTPYQFASNSSIAGIDQDGLEFFFAAGAGNDSWPGSNGYPDLMINAFRQAGINDVVQVNAHSFFKFSDINFALGKYGRQPYHTAQKEMVMISRDDFKIEDRLDSRITKSVGQVKNYLQNHPNSKQENNQLNLAGYSMGSVLMAQTALKIADEGTIIDNLILIGSTISPDSELGKTLEKYKSEGKIKNILYKNTTGDEVLYSASRGLQEDAIIKTIRTIVLGNRNEGSKHLILAGDKDDAKSNNERKRLANELVEEGVR
jgi:RHS repeat-associated protein